VSPARSTARPVKVISGNFPNFGCIGRRQDLEALGRNRHGYVRRREVVRIEDDATREAARANEMLVAREAEQTRLADAHVETARGHKIVHDGIMCG